METTMKVVLLTGANGGIGSSICEKLLAKNEYAVIAAVRNIGKGEQLIKSQLEKNPQAKITLILLDVCDVQDNLLSEVEKALRKVSPEKKAKIHCIINNAALSGDLPWDTIPKRTDERIKLATSIINANFFGPLKITKLLSTLIDNEGCIINVSSGAGFMNMGKMTDGTFKKMKELDTEEKLINLSKIFIDCFERHNNEVVPCLDEKTGIWLQSYGFSKALLNMLTLVQSKSYTFAMRNIRVNAVSPGFCATKMTATYANQSDLFSSSDGADVVLSLLDGNETGLYFDKKKGYQNCIAQRK